MFCPKCRAEFNLGVAVCQECQAPLVEQLPEETPPEYRDLVEVGAPGNQGQLAVAESLLQAAGIPYDVQNAHLQNWVDGTLALGHSIVLGPCRIYVPAEFAGAAADLLGDLAVAVKKPVQAPDDCCEESDLGK